ncbi:hypothetical protein RCL_jg3999.t1 [Rhizophagus clarus]|uniref:Uncharacterized protein n=1 Tax=Rhizophagus clarus TaxID=94130 RepID=A0A8H3KPM1_9GLOM|nr:hypothetical protein RCL_jg3999.t1 [Rhizophagus clarus]
MNTRFDGQSFGVFGHVGNSAAGSSWYLKKWEFDRERLEVGNLFWSDQFLQMYWKCLMFVLHLALDPLW